MNSTTTIIMSEIGMFGETDVSGTKSELLGEKRQVHSVMPLKAVAWSSKAGHTCPEKFRCSEGQSYK